MTEQNETDQVGVSGETPPTAVSAWHGNADLKAKVVAEIKEHRRQDAIIQGSYLETLGASGSEYRGCALGCTLAPTMTNNERLNNDLDWHEEAELRLGIPRPVAYIYEGIFERLPSDNNQHAEFVVAAVEAMPVGADLLTVRDRTMLDLLVGEPYGLIQFPDLADDVTEAIRKIASCYEARINGDEPSEEVWQEAGNLARDARAARDARDARAARDARDARDAWAAWAARAAWAAWDARAAWAAWAAWDARAAWAARDARDAWAARAARDARDARAARDAFYPWLAERFIQYCESAPLLVTSR